MGEAEYDFAVRMSPAKDATAAETTNMAQLDFTVLIPTIRDALSLVPT